MFLYLNMISRCHVVVLRMTRLGDTCRTFCHVVNTLDEALECKHSSVITITRKHSESANLRWDLHVSFSAVNYRNRNKFKKKSLKEFPGSGWSPPKSNRLLLWATPHTSKKFHYNQMNQVSSLRSTNWVQRNASSCNLIGCSGPLRVSEVPTSSFKSITWNELC